MELSVLCTCMEGKKIGEPWTWTWLHLSLANWESEAWVKYIWGHREWFSIPLKDHRSLKSITGSVHNLNYRPFSTNCSIHVWFCVVKFFLQTQTTHGHSLLLHLTYWFAVRSAEADILLQFVHRVRPISAWWLIRRQNMTHLEAECAILGACSLVQIKWEWRISIH